MVETILSSPLFVEAILPFILIFTVVFAILQKTKILGDGKRQIDAIVSLVIGLIVISFGFATGFIISLVPVLAVSVVVILVFMVIYGMTHSGKDEFKLPKGVQGVIGALAAIVVTVAVLVFSGGWNYLLETFFYAGGDSGILTNLIFVIIVIVVIGVVVWPSKGSGSDSN